MSNILLEFYFCGKNLRSFLFTTAYKTASSFNRVGNNNVFAEYLNQHVTYLITHSSNNTFQENDTGKRLILVMFAYKYLITLNKVH